MPAAEDFPGDGSDEPLTALPAELEAPHFSVEDVANTTIWPVVDKLSCRNWRQEAYPGINFQFPYHDADGLVDVNLVVCCEAEPAEEDEYDEKVAGAAVNFVSSATLEIQHTAADLLRHHILENAYAAWHKTQATGPKAYSRKELVAKTSVAYVFNSSSEVFVSSSQDVSDIYEARLLWSNEWDKENYMEYRQKLYDDHLIKIGKALMMLTGSTEYADTIDALRRRPIAGNQEL
ncbi:MAG TPA: hypothetical protein VHC21_02465 [Candidatus Saccharimonadales bacterium]|nr:hypothetical protein [Candidatus Saccharimonadales bacterium]